VALLLNLATGSPLMGILSLPYRDWNNKMKVLLTPETRFTNLPDYQFAPNFLQITPELRLHYVDEGPREATEACFTGKTISTEAGPVEITPAMAKQIYRYLVKNDKLREIEKTKIACARKFFDEIGRRVSEDRVKYDVVTSYEKLMDIVGKRRRSTAATCMRCSFAFSAREIGNGSSSSSLLRFISPGSPSRLVVMKFRMRPSQPSRPPFLPINHGASLGRSRVRHMCILPVVPSRQRSLRCATAATLTLTVNTYARVFAIKMTVMAVVTVVSGLTRGTYLIGAQGDRQSSPLCPFLAASIVLRAFGVQLDDVAFIGGWTIHDHLDVVGKTFERNLLTI
jgi:hypothetical protein